MGCTLSAFIQDALRMALARGTDRKPKHRFKLITSRGDGPKPGIDQDRTSALLEADDVDAFGRIGRK
jgi:hypothetical protein